MSILISCAFKIAENLSLLRQNSTNDYNIDLWCTISWFCFKLEVHWRWRSLCKTWIALWTTAKDGSKTQEPITWSLQLPYIPITAFFDLFLVWIYHEFRSPTGTSVTNCSHKHGLMSTCSREAALFYPYRSVFMWTGCRSKFPPKCDTAHVRRLHPAVADAVARNLTTWVGMFCCSGYYVGFISLLCGRKQIEMWFIVVCTLIDNEYAS